MYSVVVVVVVTGADWITTVVDDPPG